MSGADYLCREAAATIPTSDARPAPIAIVYGDPVPDPTMPGRLEIGGVVIAYAASGRAKVISTPETQQRGRLDCPCAVIYSKCRCHLQRRA